MRTLGTVLFFYCVCFTYSQRNFSPDNFFERYGYLDSNEGLPDAPNITHSAEDREKAIRQFQKMVGVPETGVLDRMTVRKMQGPRCGVKDLVPPRNRQSDDPNGPLPFYAIGTKWKKDTVTWKFTGYTRKLSEGQQRRAISNALAKWSAVANINFREVGSADADILIRYGTRNHGDSYPFDGESGTLAHAFFPGGDGISGDTHFDDAEPWTLNTPDGTNLEIVAAHEFGHALGISHSNVAGALMAPYYAGYDPNYGLHNDDIQAIQSIYGSKRQSPPSTARPPPRVTTQPPVTSPPKSKYCNVKFDAIFNGHDRRVYAIRRKKIYRFNTRTNGFSLVKNVRKILRGAPYSPGAVVLGRDRRIYIFKGKRYWRFANGIKESGYPKVLKGKSNWYRNVQAAFLWRDGRIYLLKGNEFSIWSESYRKPPRGYPRLISSTFRGIPDNIDAAFRWNRYTYFFKSRNYTKFDDWKRTAMDGYPKKKARAWMGCGNSPK